MWQGFKMKNEINIDEYLVKCLKLGSSFSDHFEIMIIPSEKKGKICLKDRKELTKFSYEFNENGIKEIKKFLEMIT